jgi:hypothetical protein
MKIVNSSKSIRVNHLLKATNYSRTVIAALTLTFGITTFTACSNDGDTPEVISVKDVEGSYAGKASIIFIESSTSPTPIPQIEVEATLKEDTIYFGKFPTDILITSRRQLSDRAADLHNLVITLTMCRINSLSRKF